jgi:hypothetical protein
VTEVLTASLEVKGEILKLARLLRRDPAEFEYLEQVPAADIRLLREQVTDVLFDANGPALGRLATASKLLPIKVVAIIGEHAFGPILAARIAGLLEPERAVQMANTMPIEFLADVAIELDPRRASAVIALIAPPRTADITRVLLRREDYVTMGRFVAHLSDEAIRAAIDVMSDEELLRVAFVLESRDGLAHLVALLPQSRLDSVIDAGAREGMWAELLQLLPVVPVLPLDSQRRLAREVAKLDPARRALIERQVREAGMVAQLALMREALG